MNYHLAYTRIDDMMCSKSTYGSYYRDLGSATKACDEDSNCFGLQDRKCDGHSGWRNTNYWIKCSNTGNTKKHVPSTPHWLGTCVYVKGEINYTD